MARLLVFMPAFVALLLAPLPQAIADQPVFVYQRIHSLVANHDNRISLRIWPDDTVEIRFPPYTPQAGHYRWQADVAQRNELLDLIGDLPDFSQDAIRQHIASTRRDELIEVSDADLVRFELRMEGRNEVTVMVESPDIWSRLAPGLAELDVLAAREQMILDWMRKATREERP